MDNITYTITYTEEELQRIEEERAPAINRYNRDQLLLLEVDKINAVRWALMTTEKQNEWINYRQLLLDVPQQDEFPNNIIWPTLPT